MPDAGAFRERVTIQSQVSASDGAGGGTLTWSALAINPTVWARVAPLRGDERLRAAQLQSNLSHEVLMRRRTDVTTAMRLIWGSITLNIREISQDPMKRYTTLRCEQGVAV